MKLVQMNENTLAHGESLNLEKKSKILQRNILYNGVYRVFQNHQKNLRFHLGGGVGGGGKFESRCWDSRDNFVVFFCIFYRRVSLVTGIDKSWLLDISCLFNSFGFRQTRYDRPIHVRSQFALDVQRSMNFVVKKKNSTLLNWDTIVCVFWKTSEHNHVTRVVAGTSSNKNFVIEIYELALGLMRTITC